MTKTVKNPKIEINSLVNETMDQAKKALKEKAQKAKNTKVAKAEKPKETKVIKEMATRSKKEFIEQVISNREVKYIYPEDVVDTLSRKSWRQKIRTELKKLEYEMLIIRDQDSKEFKSAKKKYDDFAKTVLKAS